MDPNLITEVETTETTDSTIEDVSIEMTNLICWTTVLLEAVASTTLETITVILINLIISESLITIKETLIKMITKRQSDKI